MNDELSRAYEYDESKFRQNAARDLDSMVTYRQTVARLIYSTHALEKSLSNDNFKKGRGLDNIKLLIHIMEVYRQREYDALNIAYEAALAALKQYYLLHKDTKHEAALKDIYGDQLNHILSCDSMAGGSSVVLKKAKKQGGEKNFKDLAEGRVSVRTYSDEAVDMEDIRDALQIAMKTPTVCNRQAIKVRYIRNKKIISDVLKLQGGVIGYETPPFLLFITVEDSAYLGANERNQGFIDGGLFVMSVLYGLEYKGLAACALNAAFTEESEVKMREMIDIPDGEKFITFISVGHFNESNNICRSFRYPLDSVISEVTELYETTNTRSVAIKQKDTLRGKLKIRARAKEALSLIKHKTRVRTRLRNARENIRRYARERSFAHPDGGIITLIDYNNYGNILQRYALQEFLYQNDLAYVSYEHDLPIASDINDPRFRYTADFVKRYVHRGTISESSTGRAYIVGSDQIWRDFSYDKPKEKIGFFFLNFIKDESARRIAYAASFGRNSLKDAKITPEISLYLKPYIQKFNAVSVREDAAVSIVKDAWNIEADVVIDPTMLLPKGIYSGLIDKVSHGLTAIDGVFSYLIGVSDENEQLLEKAYTAIGGTPYRIDLADYSGPLPQVEQWLLGLRDAKLAVVDSFHGTVFSIINNTNFIVLENKGSGMERMIHLLDVFGIKGRMITHEDVDSFVFEELQPIDWGFVNDKLEELRAQSGDWLLKAVQSDK